MIARSPMSLEARPTEYRGVLFRSKSEAVFARALDLSGLWLWGYEPKGFTVKGWVPDFWIVRNCMTKGGIFSMVLEYKPSDVTDAYKDELWKRFDRLGRQNGTYRGLVIANAYDAEVPRSLSLWISTGWVKGESPMVPTFSKLEEARHYRFDLKR